MAQKNDDPGSPAKSASDEAALHEWLKALGKEGRLVHAWLKPRLDEAVKKLEGQWLSKVKRCAWGLQWEEVGSDEPDTGEEIQNAALAEALERKRKLRQDELEQLQVQDELCSSSYIRVGGTYLKPMKTVAWVWLSELTKTMSLGKAVEILAARTLTFDDLSWVIDEGERERLWSEASKAANDDSTLQASQRSAFLAISEALGDELKPALRKLVAVLYDPHKVLGELHKVLMAPIAGALEGAEEVLVIPHGDLLAVPWAALLDESRAEQHRYLIQRHVVRVAPSLRVARAAAGAVASRSSSEHQRRSVVVGNPVPNKEGPLRYAEMEADEVARMKAQAGVGAGRVQDHVVKLTCEEASISRMLEGMQGADHVHYAGHASPETLLLLADYEELSMKQVQEKVKLARGATVVLSGCETLLGRVRPEGAVGVARAFLLAGAGSVVASLWKVDDKATMELMCDFYNELHGSEGHGRRLRAAEAMRRAMLAMIEEASGLEWIDMGLEAPMDGCPLNHPQLAQASSGDEDRV